MNRDDTARVPRPAAAPASALIDKRPQRGERASTQLVHQWPRGARRQQLNECGGSEFANAGWMAQVTWCRIRTGRLMAMVAISAVLVSLAGCERWSLDRQMEELCRKDGGMGVSDRFPFQQNEFSNVGQPLAKYARPSQVVRGSARSALRLRRAQTGRCWSSKGPIRRVARVGMCACIKPSSGEQIPSCWVRVSGTNVAVAMGSPSDSSPAATTAQSREFS